MLARCSRASTRIIRAPPTCRSGASSRSARRTAAGERTEGRNMCAALTAAAGPLTAAQFASLMAPFQPFESRPVLAAAVSGGRDSLALALLAHEWAGALDGRIVGLIVDHGLRRESSHEAVKTHDLL